jgi:hypothetical protein
MELQIRREIRYMWKKLGVCEFREGPTVPWNKAYHETG